MIIQFIRRYIVCRDSAEPNAESVRRDRNGYSKGTSLSVLYEANSLSLGNLSAGCLFQISKKIMSFGRHH